MRRIQTILLLVTFLLLGGCSQNYYVLSVASEPSKKYHISHNVVIGVEKVKVPAYLYKRDIAVATSSSQITLLSGALWGEDLDEGLSNRLIGYLQKKFRHPNVYSYPWGIDHKPTLKVTVQISRFIAQEDIVYLDAIWRIENMQTQKIKARLFSTQVKTKNDPQSIVSAMDRAFSRFEDKIAQGIHSF